MPKFLTVTEYALREGSTPAKVRRLIAEGQVEARRSDGDKGIWRVKVEDTEDIVALQAEIKELKSIVVAMANHFGLKVDDKQKAM